MALHIKAKNCTFRWMKCTAWGLCLSEAVYNKPLHLIQLSPAFKILTPYPPGTAPSPYPTHSLSLSGSGGILLPGVLLTLTFSPHYSVLPTVPKERTQ